MKICFPVKDSGGLESEVFGHFGSAPMFVLVDTESGDLAEVGNADQHHTHGMCSPLKALGGREVDGVVVGGIGDGALSKLKNSGVKVFRAKGGTVGDNLRLLNEGKLSEFSPLLVCRGHGGGGGCSNH
jgi:predicted Fe-Mo cluster-binding NifX family protein